MMRGVQQSSPQDPDPLALDVEERDASRPPFGRLRRETLQAWTRELGDAMRGSVDRERLGKYVGWSRLLEAEEFAEEAAFRQQLVFENVTNRRRAQLRTIVEIGVRELAPH